MNLILIGAPGAGKGSLSALLLQNFDIVHVATGDILREAVAAGTPVGLKAQEYMNKGELVPDSVIHDIIAERLAKPDIKKGFVFDGYPRTVEQAEDLDTILDELGLKIDYVINLDANEDVIASRITNRRLCRKCGKIYHMINHPAKVEGVCDDCGGELYTRKDDTLESLKTRLSSYYKNTQPVIDYYRNKGLVIDFDSNTTIEADVYDHEKFVPVLNGLKSSAKE